jgi:ankyrin repeat protein
MTSKKLAIIFISAFVLGTGLIIGLFIANKKRTTMDLSSVFKAIDHNDYYAVSDIISVFRAIDHNDYYAVIDIITKKPELVNEKDTSGNTPLHIAATLGRREIAILLLSNDANVNAKDIYLRTPLHAAALNKRYKGTIQALIENGANVNAKDQWGSTPLEDAIPRPEPVGGAEPNDLNPFALRQFIEPERKLAGVETTKLLLAMGADPNTTDSKIDRPLVFQAAFSGLEEVVEVFLVAGADVNFFSQSNLTLLHVAVMVNNKAMVELLLSHGANVNAEAIGRATPLFVAEYYKYDEIAELLRKHDGRVVDVGNEKP